MVCFVAAILFGRWMCRLLRRILTIIAVVIMFRSIVNSQYSPDIRGHLHRAVIGDCIANFVLNYLQMFVQFTLIALI